MDPPKEQFAHTELARALEEQAYGLKSFELSKKTHLESMANVTTLEGNSVTISLTPRGYQIQRDTSGEEGLVYESIEEALQVVSPLYLQAKQRLLVEKLSSISFQPTELRKE